ISEAVANMLPRGEPPERGGMSKLGTLVDTKSEAFDKNTEAFSGLVEELRKLSAEARRGGGEKAQRRHRERGKLLVRERIDRLLDPGSLWYVRRKGSRGGDSHGGRPRLPA